MSKKRQRMSDPACRIVYLDAPCPVIEGSVVRVVGVDVRERMGPELLAYWRQELHRRNSKEAM
jgi:hypothetical protein